MVKSQLRGGMRGRAPGLWLGVLLGCFVLGVDQEPLADARVPLFVSPPAQVRVQLGSDTGLPGGVVMIPLLVDTPEGRSAAALTVEIGFPAKLLEFVKARIALTAENVGATLHSELETEKEANTSQALLRLTMAAPKELPSGTVASIQFRISSEPGPTKDIPLQLRSVVLSSPDGSPIRPIDSQDGKISVSSDPPTMLNCFFFSH